VGPTSLGSWRPQECSAGKCQAQGRKWYGLSFDQRWILHRRSVGCRAHGRWKLDLCDIQNKNSTITHAGRRLTCEIAESADDYQCRSPLFWHSIARAHARSLTHASFRQAGHAPHTCHDFLVLNLPRPRKRRVRVLYRVPRYFSASSIGMTLVEGSKVCGTCAGEAAI
jgi:hypothetical protein